jgi:hypothetical protein
MVHFFRIILSVCIRAELEVLVPESSCLRNPSGVLSARAEWLGLIGQGDTGENGMMRFEWVGARLH